ncbi:MAG: serine/threonine-protein kinase [Myxococcota bacterium]
MEFAHATERRELLAPFLPMRPPMAPRCSDARETALPFSPVDVADIVLAAATNGGLRGVALTPGPSSTTIEALTSVQAREVATVSRDSGLEAIARLAQLAGIELAARRGGMGRFRATVAGCDLEFVVDVRSTGGELARTEVLKLSAGETSIGPTTPEAGLTTHPYVIESELGRGGMGIVYKAFHATLERYVAIKVLHAHRALQQKDRSRFLREARAASRVRHPGVAAVLDFGTLTDGRGFMVMELVDGDTLRLLLDRGPLEPIRAARIMQQIASAIEAAHEHGVIHRDLKPENVFVLPHDRIKIVDFGAAKLLASSIPGDTADGRVLGTPRYMAPEHAMGAGTDRRTDVYALGCVLFEMLTGKPPYEEEAAAVVMMRHTQAPIPKLQLESASLTRALNRVVRRAMAKAPRDRYPSARALKRDLATVIHDAERGGWWQRFGL